ncbi:hypothetical protein ACX80N_16765 [Arthrobacter sp. MDT2-16]
MMDEDVIPFRWLTAESLVPYTSRALIEAGAELQSDSPEPMPDEIDSNEDDAGFEPMILIAGAAAVALLARTVARIIQDHRHGGVVIDLRDGDLTVRERVRGVDAGTVVVVDASGAQMISSPDEGAVLKLLKI